MVKLKILVWEKGKEPGEPTVEVTIPSYLVKWATKMMSFIEKEEPELAFLKDLDLDELVKEAIERGENEIMEVKAEGTLIKIFLEQ